MAKISAIVNSRPSSFRSMETFINCGRSDVPYYIDKEREKVDENKEDRLLEGKSFLEDLKLKTKADVLKYSSALTTYPALGFSGSKNANFYQFLTMGMFPYITGSLTFIALFNGVTKHFAPKCASEARKYGLGMALGVIFYGLAKTLAKKVITKSVALKTGIDMDKPYIKVVNNVQTPEEVEIARQARIKAEAEGKHYKEDEHSNERSFEYHTAFESVDFPRTDLLYNTKDYRKRNEVYDEIARKNGFGTNLADSDQEVRPFIKGVVTKAKTAQTLSQYLWAAVGVGIGVQAPWTKLLDIEPRKYSGVSLGKHIKIWCRTLKEATKEACKHFWNGGEIGKINPKSRVAGRVLSGAAALTTVLGIINAVKNPYMKNDENMKAVSVFNDASKVVEE